MNEALQPGRHSAHNQAGSFCRSVIRELPADETSDNVRKSWNGNYIYNCLNEKLSQGRVDLSKTYKLYATYRL